MCACLSELRDLVKALPHNERILAACTDTAVLVADAPVAHPTPPVCGRFWPS